MFKLTDGSQTVQGMEYRPISCLSPQTQPGSKVRGSFLSHTLCCRDEMNIKMTRIDKDNVMHEDVFDHHLFFLLCRWGGGGGGCLIDRLQLS